MLINADSGHGRTNHSWVLSRLLRDFDHWRPTRSVEIEKEKLEQLKKTTRIPISHETKKRFVLRSALPSGNVRLRAEEALGILCTGLVLLSPWRNYVSE